MLPILSPRLPIPLPLPLPNLQRLDESRVLRGGLGASALEDVADRKEEDDEEGADGDEENLGFDGEMDDFAFGTCRGGGEECSI